jgi:prepilin peptidase CpaA
MLDVLLPAFVAGVAAVSDAFYRRIPNWLTVGAVCGGILLHAWKDGGSGALFALLGVSLGLVLLLPFYALNAIGAGDVKLLAGIGALVGPQALITIAMYGALVGGAMSLLILGRRAWMIGSLRGVVAADGRLTLSGAKSPYGIAIAAGVYLSMLMPGVTS